MRSLDDVNRAFAFGWDETHYTMDRDELQAHFKELARLVWYRVPDGPEKTLALRELWSAQTKIQLALSLQDESDS